MEKQYKVWHYYVATAVMILSLILVVFLISPQQNKNNSNKNNTQLNQSNDDLQGKRLAAINSLQSLKGYDIYKSDEEVIAKYEFAKKEINSATSVEELEDYLIKHKLLVGSTIENAHNKAKIDVINQLKTINGFNKYESNIKVKEIYDEAVKLLNKATANNLNEIKKSQKILLEQIINDEHSKTKNAVKKVIISVLGYKEYKDDPKVTETYNHACDMIDKLLPEDNFEGEKLLQTQSVISAIEEAHQAAKEAILKEIEKIPGCQKYKGSNEVKKIYENAIKEINGIKVEKADTLEGTKETQIASITVAIKEEHEVAKEAVLNEIQGFSGYDECKNIKSLKSAYENAKKEINEATIDTLGQVKTTQKGLVENAIEEVLKIIKIEEGKTSIFNLEFSIDSSNDASIDGFKDSNTDSIVIPTYIKENDQLYTVTSIGDDAFYSCTNLKSIVIPKTVTSIGAGALNGCANLASITIPEGVTSIGAGAFNGCANLASITIPEGVTSIGDFAFYGCRKLASIRIPAGVTRICAETFYGCANLASITIPAGVTSIGDFAFCGCRNLASITIPKTVTHVGFGAFDSCNNLTINCEAKTKPDNWDEKWNRNKRPVVWGYKA